LTPERLARRTAALRIPIPSEARDRIRASHGLLSAEARRLAERWRPLVTAHAAALGRWATLRRMAEDALAALRLIEQETARPLTTGCVPPDVLAALALRAEGLRDRLAGQCRLMTEATETAAEVVPVLGRIANGTTTSAAVVFGIARGLLHEPRPRPGIEAVLIDPRVIADGWTAWPADAVLADAFLGGWQTARLIARALQPLVRLDEPAALAAVTGALLQDVGLVNLRRNRQPAVAAEDVAAARHAAVSAALVGALSDAPLELVRVVAGHHDRGDGSGPATMWPVSSSVRLVAAANRLGELIEAPDGPADFVLRCAGAVERLDRECARGWWSGSARDRLAECVPLAAQIARQWREHWPHHAHHELAGPHEPTPVRGVDTLDLGAASIEHATDTEATERSEAA
jgi:hypothetical protein